MLNNIFWHFRHDHKRIHMPSCGHDVFLLRIAPFTYICSLASMLISIFNTGDFSWASIKLYAAVLLIGSALFAGVIAIIYFFTTQSDTILHISGATLSVVKEKQELQYSLDSIDCLTIVLTSGRGYGGCNKRDLFIVTKTGDKLHIYSDDWAIPKAAWNRVSDRLPQVTGKKLLFETYVEDFNGQILERDAFLKKITTQLRKKMGF